MDFEQLRDAFLEADRRARAGDKKAAEDAKFFAEHLQGMLPPEQEKEQPGIGKRLVGGAAAAVDFVGDMVPDAIAGVGGLAKGAYDAATTDKSFLDASADSIRQLQENLESMRGGMGKITGTFDTDAYRTAQEALATPAAAGTMAVRGLGALGRLPAGGVEGAVQGLEEPWRNPITSAFSDAAGPLLGYPIAGRAGKAISENTVQVKPFQRPAPVAEPLPPEPTPLEYPRDKLGGTLKEGESVESFYPEGMAEQPRSPVTGEPIPFEPAEGATWQGRPIERPTPSNLLEDSAIQAQRRRAERERMEAWERENNERRYPEDIDRPLEFGLSLEDRPLREEVRQADNDRITRDREDFPTMDIDLLPEKVAKDSVVKGMITRWNNEQAKLRELYSKANELGLEGTRVRAGELGMTKKSKGEINKLREEIATLEKKLNNISQQLQNRMTNRHGIDVEGMPLFKGVEEKGMTPEGRIEYTGGKFSNEVPSVRGPAERTTGLTVEKTERGNMQRSPDAKVTGAEMVEKTKAHPLGGVGKKQGGAVDPAVFKEGIEKLKKFFTDEVLNKLGESPKFKRRDRVVLMPIDSFLTYAAKLPGQKADSHKLQGVTEYLASGNKLEQPLDLWVSQKTKGADKVTGHEGRHRALYLKSQGIDMVPVRINSDRIRWSEQNNPKNEFDYIQNFPEKLINEDGNLNFDFPIPREEATLPNAGNFSRGVPSRFRQSGAIDTSVFTEGLGKLFRKDKSTPPSRPAPKANTPITRYMLEDTRNIDQFWKEESPRAGEWKDLSDSLFQKIVQGKFVASMARNLNPVAQYLTSKVVSLDRMANEAKENALWGNKFVDNLRGWSKRVKSDDGALTFFESGKAKEVSQVHETLLKYDDADVLKAQGLDRPTEQMLRADGLNDAQVKAVNAVYDQIGKLFDEVNKRLTAAGKDTMKKIPGYIPHMWFGDYRVALKDPKTGEILDIRGANNKKEAASISAEMQKRFPDRKVETFDAHRNRYKMDDVSAFQYALQMLQKGTPEHTIMNKVYKDIVAHRGFKTHALQRKGAKGFAGSEVSRTGTKDFTKAMEAYFNQGYNFIANMEKKKVYAELKKKLDEGKVDLPNTRKFVDEYVSHSTGGMESKLQFIDELIQGAGERAGMGPGAIKRGIQNMNALASFFFLTSGKFLAANTVQPLYNWAKLRNIALDFDAPGATRTMAKAYMETFLGQTSAKTKQGLSWAKQNGYIDAKTIELMNTKLNKVNAVNSFVYKGSKHSLGWWEQEVVRTPTFVMYDLALRDVIKNDKERWETAGALTDKYMVDYGKSESPFFYEQMGTVGEATRPLKQYGHAYAGQLGEYVKLATEDKQYSPLAGFLASQITVSGLKGLPLVGTAAALINALNNSFGTTFQTPEEALLGSGLSSAWVFGPISTETGIDISGSVSAPGVEDIWGMPGLSFAGSALGAGAEFAGKMARGTVTDMDVMKTIPKVMPNPHVQALTEKAFSEDGVVPDPNNRGLPRLSNPRTPMEEAVRIGTGAQLTREQEEKAVANAFKRENQRDSKVKKEVMDKLVDQFVKGEPFTDELKERYMEAGGDPKNVKKELKTHMKNMAMSQLEREIFNSKGLTQAQKIEKLRKFSQILEDAGAEDLVELLRD